MNNYKTILGVESSCDETAAAVLQKNGDQIRVLSNVVASSSQLQDKFGGVIPEQAAREQLKSIIPVIETAIKDSRIEIKDLDAIAVTYGPGLIGSLLIGVETAKVLARVWEKPLIPVNHLIGHFYANFIQPSAVSSQSSAGTEITSSGDSEVHRTSSPRNDDDFQVPTFPCIGLLVSGGHTDLVLFKDQMKYVYLGGTRDDAAGECFDKCARLMGLPYPGGPEISRLAKSGDGSKIKLPKPMINSGDFDFSFSGLKTAVANIISEEQQSLLSEVRKTLKPEDQSVRDSDAADNPSLSESFRNDLAASIEQTIIDVLIKKTIGAADKYGISEIMIAGGVAANDNLSARLRRFPHVVVRNPQKIFCTDNAAMVAAAAFFIDKPSDPLSLQANPNLSL